MLFLDVFIYLTGIYFLKSYQCIHTLVHPHLIHEDDRHNLAAIIDLKSRYMLQVLFIYSFKAHIECFTQTDVDTKYFGWDYQHKGQKAQHLNLLFWKLHIKPPGMLFS